MFQHPDLLIRLAEERIADLHREADARRLAALARRGRPLPQRGASRRLRLVAPIRLAARLLASLR